MSRGLLGCDAVWCCGRTFQLENPKKPLEGHRRRWEDNIRLDLRGIGWEGVDWMVLAEDGDQWHAVVNTVMNLRVP